MVEDRKFRCVACMHDWQGEPDGGPCPNCKIGGETYQLNIDRRSHWECVKCKYDWTSESGWECPACGALESPPCWTCKKCSFKWISEESNPCPDCGQPIE